MAWQWPAAEREILAAERAKPCKHCGRRKRNRPRGLCWGCYYTPAVRERYGPSCKYGRRSEVGQGNGGYRLPAVPTASPPGSPEKVAVLEASAAAGEALFHPLDAGWEAW